MTLRRIAVVVLFAAASVRAGGQAPLTLVTAIELPAVEGRIDHLAADRSSQRLFVAALGNNTVEVVDLEKARHLKSLSGFREPQGIAFVPDAGVVAVANGQGNGLQVIDAKDFRSLRSIRLGDDADNIRYDAAAKRLVVGFGGGALAVVDAMDGAVLGQTKLAGHPESFQLERSGPRAFVNVPSAGHIAVVDRIASRVVATWPVAAAGANYPMSLDEAGHRLFVGCRSPAKILVYDTAGGRQIAAFETVADADDLWYDAGRKRLYVTGGEGFIDVHQESTTNRFARIARVATARGARTSLFVAGANRLYVAVPRGGTQRAEIRVYDAR